MISFNTRAHTASSSSAMLEQARCNMHDTSRYVTTRTTRRACCVVTCRDAPSGIWA